MEAEAQLETVKEAARERPKHRDRRQQAARERAARDRKARLQEALRQLPHVEAAKKKKKKKKDREKARVSSTDPDARVMKMPDGGFVKQADIEEAEAK